MGRSLTPPPFRGPAGDLLRPLRGWMMDGGTAGLPQPGDVNASMYSWKRESSLFSSFVPACRSFVVYTCKKKNSQQHKQMNIYALGFFFHLWRVASPFEVKIGFQLIFQCVAYPPTHTFAIELLLHEKKNKISKEAQVYFHIGAGQATAAIIFRVTCTYIHTDTRIHMKRRESWEFFFGLYSWLSTADPRPVRHETLTESDLFRLVFLLVCGASKLFLTTTTDKIGFYYFHLVVWIVFFLSQWKWNRHAFK